MPETRDWLTREAEVRLAKYYGDERANEIVTAALQRMTGKEHNRMENFLHILDRCGPTARLVASSLRVSAALRGVRLELTP